MAFSEFDFLVLACFFPLCFLLNFLLNFSCPSALNSFLVTFSLNLIGTQRAIMSGTGLISSNAKKWSRPSSCYVRWSTRHCYHQKLVYVPPFTSNNVFLLYIDWLGNASTWIDCFWSDVYIGIQSFLHVIARPSAGYLRPRRQWRQQPQVP